MNITPSAVVSEVSSEFAARYPQFSKLQNDIQYRPYWDLYNRAIGNADFLRGAIFCNDVFRIPPVRTFLTVYRQEVDALVEQDTPTTDLKQAIGAAFGMVFKHILHYEEQKSTSIPRSGAINIKYATYYYAPATPVHIVPDHD